MKRKTHRLQPPHRGRTVQEMHWNKADPKDLGAPSPTVGTPSLECIGTRGSRGSHTQARVEAAGVTGLLLQVLAVCAQLPGVSEVLHQGLDQARGRQEVVPLVAVVIPAQPARPPRVDRGQLQGTDHVEQPPQQPQLACPHEMVFIKKKVPRSGE